MTWHVCFYSTVCVTTSQVGTSPALNLRHGGRHFLRKLDKKNNFQSSRKSLETDEYPFTGIHHFD
jgi:hypothetical protein